MTFLPIVDRELRVRARAPATYRARYIGTALAFGISMFLLISGANPGSSKGNFGFNILSFTVFVCCLFEGVRNTADSLSEEKRAGTLGFLFLTDLKGYDVVLGKAIASTLNSFYILLAILPALALPLLLGGVTAGEFWRLVLVLLETLFLSLSIGMLISSISRSERRAWLASLALVVFLAAVPPLVRFFPFHLARLVAWLSPSTAFMRIQAADFDANPTTFWYAAAGVAMLSVAALVTASIILPRSWQDLPKVNQPAAVWQRELLPQASEAIQRAEKQLLNQNPVAWLTARDRGLQFWLWVVVGTCGFFAVVLWIITQAWTALGIGFVIGALIVHFIIAVCLAFNVCYNLSDAKQSGALELLFSTPLKPREIVDGFLLGQRRIFSAPVITLLWIEAVLLVSHTVMIALKDASSSGFFVFAILVTMMVVFVMDLHAIAIFGMWTALHAKKPSQAFTKTVMYVLVLPTIQGLCCVTLPLTGILKNMIFLSYRVSLYDRFRQMITEPAQPAEPWKSPLPNLAPRPAPPLPSVLDQ